MKRNLIMLIAAWLLMAIGARAQTLSVASVETEADTQAELVVTLSGVASKTTALQFNLHLPEGITLDETTITKGTAVSNHTLDIRPLEGGDRLFVFYNMDKALITNGELLRLPITTGSEAGTLSGNINQVRTATTDAVSHSATGGSFTINIKDETATRIERVQKPQEVDWHSLDGIKINNQPAQKGVYIKNGQKVVVK